jgi:hypothetical protein
VLFVGTLTSWECPYCGSPIQREHVHTAGTRIPVDGVLSFRIPKERAQTNLAEWVRSRWFAPNEFRKRGAEGKINGVYLPFWTYDALTIMVLRPEESITTTVGSGDAGVRRWIVSGFGCVSAVLRRSRGSGGEPESQSHASSIRGCKRPLRQTGISGGYLART